MALASYRKTVTTAPTPLAVARNGRQVLVRNAGAVGVYVGGVAVNSSIGFLLEPGAAFGWRLTVGETLYAVTDSSSATVHILANQAYGAYQTSDYLEARSGIARAGVTYADWFRPYQAFVTIGGTDRSSNCRNVQGENECVITERWGAPSTCTLRVWDITPTLGAEIIVGIGSADNRWFAGHILHSTQVAEYGYKDNVAYDLTCLDYTWLLDHRLVFKRYASQACDTVVKDLMSAYAPTFTTRYVESGLATIEQKDFDGTKTVSQVLTDLARDIGATWRVDYYKRLHFRTTAAAQNPNAFTTWNTLQSLVYNQSIDQARTRVYVTGAKTQTYNDTTAAGSTTMQVDAATGFASSGTIRVKGQTITYTSIVVTSGPPYYATLNGIPASGTGSISAAIEKGAEVVNIIQRDDSAAQTTLEGLLGTGYGIRESWISDDAVTTAASAQQRGDAELDLLADSEKSAEYVTRAKFHHPGRTMSITLGSPTSITSGNLTIHDVTFTELEVSRELLPLRRCRAGTVLTKAHVDVLVDAGRPTPL